MFADIHSHILHAIDDGPKTLSESVELVEMALEDGIDRIVATPHFYATRHGLEEHISLAEERFTELSGELEHRNIPVKLGLGYEVRYFDGISRCDAVDRLCLNGSRVLLLELGSIPVTDAVINEISELEYYGYTVVLAHIERYSKMPGFKNLKPLIKKRKVISQLNASSFITGPFVRAANRLLKKGMVSVISSDMHSVDARPPQVTEAYKLIEKKVGTLKKNVILHQTDRLFDHIVSN